MPTVHRQQVQHGRSAPGHHYEADDLPEQYEDVPPPSSVKVRTGGLGMFYSTVIILLPWAIFTLILCLFVFAYKDKSWLVWTLVALCLLLAFLFVANGERNHYNPQRALGLLSLVAVVVAMMVGLAIQSEYLDEYWRIEGGATYWDVSASSEAKDYADATTINFHEGTLVDTDYRVVGYMEEGVVYCVAPVLADERLLEADGLSVATKYWAAGKDCCNKRSNFTCEDAGESNARSGVVLKGDSPDHEKFSTAVRMAQAVYNLPVMDPIAENFIFMRWVKNPEDEEEDMWLSALMMVMVVSTAYLLASGVAAGLLRMYLKKQASSSLTQSQENGE